VKCTDFESLSLPNHDLRRVKLKEVLLLVALAGVTSVLARMLNTERDNRPEVGEPNAGVKDDGTGVALGVEMPIVDELALKLAGVISEEKWVLCGVGAIELVLLETVIEGGEEEKGAEPILRGCADMASTRNTSKGPESPSLL
jgi:hypothetical protein